MLRERHPMLQRKSMRPQIRNEIVDFRAAGIDLEIGRFGLDELETGKESRSAT